MYELRFRLKNRTLAALYLAEKSHNIMNSLLKGLVAEGACPYRIWDEALKTALRLCEPLGKGEPLPIKGNELLIRTKPSSTHGEDIQDLMYDYYSLYKTFAAE